MRSNFKSFLFLILAFMSYFPVMASETNYKQWEKHDVKGIYIEVQKESDYDVEKDDRYFQKYRRLSSGVYEIEVTDKVSSKLWKIRGTSYYLLFRFPPYLYKFDEGVLEWDGFEGTFYKKP